MGETGRVPGIGDPATSYLLVLASIAVLVIYVHHIGRSLRVSALIELVGDDTRQLIDRRYPDGPIGRSRRGHRPIVGSASGVVTSSIGTDVLVAEAERAACTLELVPARRIRAGGGPLFLVHGDPSELDEDRLQRGVEPEARAHPRPGRRLRDAHARRHC